MPSLPHPLTPSNIDYSLQSSTSVSLYSLANLPVSVFSIQSHGRLLLLSTIAEFHDKVYICSVCGGGVQGRGGGYSPAGACWQQPVLLDSVMAAAGVTWTLLAHRHLSSW